MAATIDGSGPTTVSAAGATRRASLAIAAAAILWSTGGVLVKATSLGAGAVVCGRSAIAALFFLFVVRARISGARALTSVAYAGTVMTFIVATKLTTAANAVFLQYSGSAYVLLLGPWLLGERARRREIVCAVVSLGGVGVVLAGGGELGHFAGDAVGALSGVFFAFTLVLMRRDARAGANGDAPLGSVTMGNVLAALVAAPFALRDLRRATFVDALVLLYLGAVAIGVAYLLFTRGLRRTPAARASVIASLEPVLNPLWVCLLAGERPASLALVGGALVVGSVAAAAR